MIVDTYSVQSFKTPEDAAADTITQLSWLMHGTIRTVQYQNVVFQIGNIPTALLLINGQDPHRGCTCTRVYRVRNTEHELTILNEQ